MQDRKDGRTEGQKDRLKDGRKEGQTEGRTGRTDRNRQTDAYRHIHMQIRICRTDTLQMCRYTQIRIHIKFSVLSKYEIRGLTFRAN